MTCFSHNTRMVFWCYEFFTWSCLSWWRIIIAACFSAHLLVLLSEKRILSLDFWSPMLVQVTWLFHNTMIVFWYIFFSLNVTIKKIFSKSMVFSPSPAQIFYLYFFFTWVHWRLTRIFNFLNRCIIAHLVEWCEWCQPWVVLIWFWSLAAFEISWFHCLFFK